MKPLRIRIGEVELRLEVDGAAGTHGSRRNHAGRDRRATMCRGVIREMLGRGRRLVVMNRSMFIIMVMTCTEHMIDLMRKVKRFCSGRVPAALHSEAMQRQ